MRGFIKAALYCTVPLLVAEAWSQRTTVRVDAGHIENDISLRMCASFLKTVAEDVKWGLTGEMVHDSSFEEATDYLGLTAS
ncbi:MAG: hypothetical protein ABI380_09410 [Edaphobacter sp.]